MSTPRSSDGSVPVSYFEDKFRVDIDPWKFRTSAYEQDKYRATLGALTKSRYGSALEVGCAIGVLSALLAPQCERLLALDGSDTALAEAARQDLPRVRFERAFLPRDFPKGAFDLIILSEVLYYFSESDLAQLAEKCLVSLNPDGEMILCHWLGETDYPLTGHQASDLFVKTAARPSSTRVILHDDIYRLERLSFAR